MRGLVEENEDKTRLQPIYTVSPDFLRHLGLHDLGELPEYAAFHHNEKIDAMLEDLQKQDPQV
jgi:chromosome segregation and condensation protein ScpB